MKSENEIGKCHSTSPRADSLYEDYCVLIARSLHTTESLLPMGASRPAELLSSKAIPLGFRLT